MGFMGLSFLLRELMHTHWVLPHQPAPSTYIMILILEYELLTANIFSKFWMIEKISENWYGIMPSVFQLGSSEKNIYIDGQNRRGGFFHLPLFYA